MRERASPGKLEPMCSLRPIVLSLALVIASAVAAAPKEVGPCLAEPDAVRRNTCVDRALESGNPGDAAREDLRRWIARDAPAVERWSGIVLGRGGTAAPKPPRLDDADRAAWIELLGQSLAAQGKRDAAADAYREAVAADDGATRLTWFGEDGKTVWSAGLDAGTGRLERAARAALEAGRRDEARALTRSALALGATGWARAEGSQLFESAEREAVATAPALSVRLESPPAPDIEIRTAEGGPVKLSALRGKVVLLDFWASWCTPCLKELPHLERLHAAQKMNGLEAIAVNVREGDEDIGRVVKALGLTVPVARSSEAVEAAFDPRVLPAVVLIDRGGRIRARWDGYQRGLEETIAQRVRGLLAETGEPAGKKLADVLFGAGALEVAAWKDLAATVAGVAVVAGDGGAPLAAATAGGRLTAFDAKGNEAARSAVPSSAGKLVSLSPNGSAATRLAAFRSGGTEVVLSDGIGRSPRPLEVPFPVLDVVPVPGAAWGDDRVRIVLATTGGLLWQDAADAAPRKIEGSGETNALARAGEGRSARVAALDRAGRVSWLDAQGRVVGSFMARSGDRRLVTAPGRATGIGVAPSWVAAAVAGRFLRDGRVQIAAATISGQLVVLDAADGVERFRAAWPGLVDLAAGDLDGDGFDELVVGYARNLTILTAPRPAGGATAPR